MNKKSLLACLAIGILALGACQKQGKGTDEVKSDIANKTWTNGMEFFGVAKCDSGYACEGGTTHEGGIMFMLVPTDDGFIAAKGNNGLAKNDSNYIEAYCFTGEEGDKFLQKVFNGKDFLVQYNKDNKAIGTYFQTEDIHQTMDADVIRYLFSGEFTKDDGTKIVFDATKKEVKRLAETSSYELIDIYDLPSGSFKLGNESFNVQRTDEGITLQPIKQSKEDEEVWDEVGKPIVLKRVQGSEDQMGNVSKDVLTTTQLGYFSKGERKKMLDNLKAKGDKASEIETINLQLLEVLVADDTESE